MSAFVASHTMPRHGADATAERSPAALALLRTFHTLDALRGVAAVTVVLFHAAFFYRISHPAEGQIAVDLFFVMSGFVVAYRYEDELRSGMSLWRFTRIRLIRLYPLFLLGAIIGVLPALFAIATGHGDPLYRGLLASFPLTVLMLPSRYAMPHLAELYPINAVAWSLALEIVVNIIYAATIRFWTLRRLLIVVGLSFLGLCLCAARYGTLKYGYDWPQAEVGPVRIAYGFTMGVVICRLYKRKPFMVRIPWWVLIAAALALFFFHSPWGAPAWEVFAISVLVPGIVIAAIVNEPPKALQGACAVAGLLSYVVYSLHEPFIGIFLRGQDRLHLDLNTQTPMDSVIFTVLLIALCLVAHHCYDKPIRRLLTRRLRAQPTTTFATTARLPG